MTDFYNGRSANLGFVSPVGILSSTNTNPVEITTSAPHGYMTGDAVLIYDHEVNTDVNGTATIVVVSPTKFTVDGVAGIGVGGATGAVLGQITNPSQFEMPTDGEDRDAASVDVALEHLADRAALLQTLVKLGLFPTFPRIEELAAHTDVTNGSNGTAAPNSSVLEISNSRFTLDKLSTGQIVLFFYGVNADTDNSQGHIGLGIKEYAPGASASGFSLIPGTPKHLHTAEKNAITLFGMHTYSAPGGNLDVCLTGFTTGAGNVTFYGNYYLIAVVFG